MTEQEWLASDDPLRMLAFVRHHAHSGIADQPYVSDRKLRLFACAACRLAPIEGEMFAVGVAERFADGQATRKDLLAAQQTTVGGGVWTVCMEDAASATRYLMTDGHFRGMEAQLAALLRDVCGNPFRRQRLCGQQWGDREDQCHKCDRIRTPTVVSLAEDIYIERAFDRLPILADALEEAGCTNDDIIKHCRGGDLWKTCPQCEEYPADPETNAVECSRCDGTFIVPDQDSDPLHVRGCWVVDLILGKE